MLYRFDPMRGQLVLAKAILRRQDLVNYVDHDGADDKGVMPQIKKWRQTSGQNFVPGKSSQNYINNAAMIEDIHDKVARPSGYEFRGIQDSKKRLQSGMAIRDNGDHIHIGYLASAPHNLPEFKGNPHALKGAGAELIRMAAMESGKKGYNGRVKLYALPGSEGFYEKMGLSHTGGFNKDGHPEYELTPRAARKLYWQPQVKPVQPHLKPVQPQPKPVQAVPLKPAKPQPSLPTAVRRQP